MKALALCAALGACSGPSYVIDGDTFVRNGEHIRVLGMDAPELHPAHCASEASLGEAAKARLAALLRQSPAISREGHDRYGRTLALVTVNGKDISMIMVQEGLARPYYGGQRWPWCHS